MQGNNPHMWDKRLYAQKIKQIRLTLIRHGHQRRDAQHARVTQILT
jgi:hypothetical protein